MQARDGRGGSGSKGRERERGGQVKGGEREREGGGEERMQGVRRRGAE